MRFFISRILKNFSPLFRVWNFLLENFDRYHYETKWQEYAIMPFGCYCLPRFITTISRLKPRKAYGEKTCPFDLLFSNLRGNVNLLKTGFNDFFNDITFDKDKNYYVNKKYNIDFFHDRYITLEEFKERYEARIKNLYEYLNDKRHAYILIATFEPPEISCLKELAETIGNYRANDTFDIIVINQSKMKIESGISNIHIIETSYEEFAAINREGDWIGEFTYMRTLTARRFYNKLLKELKKIIK